MAAALSGATAAAGAARATAAEVEEEKAGAEEGWTSGDGDGGSDDGGGGGGGRGPKNDDALRAVELAPAGHECVVRPGAGVDVEVDDEREGEDHWAERTREAEAEEAAEEEEEDGANAAERLRPRVGERSVPGWAGETSAMPVDQPSGPASCVQGASGAGDWRVANGIANERAG